MNRRISIYQIAALTVFAVSALLSIVRISVVRKNIEIGRDTNIYFIDKNTETIGFVIFSCCFAIAFIVLAIFMGKKANSFRDLESTPVIFSSALCGFMLMATGFYYSYQIIANGNNDTGRFLVCLLMICASIMFLYLAVSKDGMNKRLVPYMRIGVCLYAIVRLVVDFIEQNSFPSNSAIVYHILSLASFMLFMIYEGKADFGVASMRYYLITGYLCMFFMMLYALPNLVLTMHVYPSIDTYVLLSAVDIVIAFYVFTRVYSVTVVLNENHEFAENQSK